MEKFIANKESKTMIKAILDPQFQPMAKVVTEFQKNVKEVEIC